MFMKNKITLLLLVLSTFVFAQNPPYGHLTIFSEDGDKFYLILNGEKINDVPQTNLRVEELNQPYYNAKIIFADATLEPVSKNSLMLTDVDGIFADVTYKIRRDKNKATKMKMNYFSSIPVRPDFIPPSNVHVIHYGQPVPPPVQQVVIQQPVTTGTVHQTTTTTTTSSGSGTGINAGINVDGVGIGVNINVNDGMMGGTSTTTHTTTTTTGGNTVIVQPVEPQPVGCAGARPMQNTSFNNAIQTLTKINFDDTKLKTANQIAQSNCLTTNQISQIAKLFSFEDNTLAFAKFAYESCTDPQNYFNLNSIFKFDSNAEALSEYISGR
jgi:hypothetical protein